MSAGHERRCTRRCSAGHERCVDLDVVVVVVVVVDGDGDVEVDATFDGARMTTSAPWDRRSDTQLSGSGVGARAAGRARARAERTSVGGWRATAAMTSGARTPASGRALVTARDAPWPSHRLACTLRLSCPLPLCNVLTAVRTSFYSLLRERAPLLRVSAHAMKTSSSVSRATYRRFQKSSSRVRFLLTTSNVTHEAGLRDALRFLTGVRVLASAARGSPGRHFSRSRCRSSTRERARASKTRVLSMIHDVGWNGCRARSRGER